MTGEFHFTRAFSHLLAAPLDGDCSRKCFDAILRGAWSAEQIAAFLGALRMRQETPELLLAAATSMRAAMLPVRHRFERVLDTCGTGGDGSGTVNLSTGAAIICAALGVVVAKHGNRAASSKAGSADVLEALGLPTTLSPEATEKVLAEVGLAFMMAPSHHPAMRFAAPVRRQLQIRTIFNCLGPLVNPAGATHQLIGAFSDELRPTLAASLRLLGTRRAWVVRGRDGMDEVSPYAPTAVTQLVDGELSEIVVDPTTFALEFSPPGAAQGGSAEENADILRKVLDGQAHPARQAFVLNAAAALVVALGIEPKAAAQQASATLADGRARAKLSQWLHISQRYAE